MIPVILIHEGASSRYPLDLIRRQAETFGNTCLIVSDQPGPYLMQDYSKSALEFAKSYVHMSTNHVAFEKFCFGRWFILREFMERERFDKVLYTDSDVLLYCNAGSEFDRWCGNAALTLALGTSPATSYFTLAGVRAFTDFVNMVYVNRGPLFAEFERIYKEMRAQDLPGGIVDMTLFRFFKQEARHIKVGEMTAIIGDRTWDHNINSADGFQTANGRKAIFFNGAFPMCDLTPDTPGWDLHPIRFNALHFQGQAKRLLREFVR